MKMKMKMKMNMMNMKMDTRLKFAQGVVSRCVLVIVILSCWRSLNLNLNVYVDLNSNSNLKWSGGMMLMRVLSVTQFQLVADAFEIRLVNMTESECLHEDDGVGVVGTDSCLAAHLRFVDKHDDAPFLRALYQFDENPLVRRIYIDAMALPIHGNVSVIGHAMDEFLTPRPWWMVIAEKYKIHHEHADRQTTHAFLMRFNPLHEKHLRTVAMIQFPPSEVCAETPLLLGHMLDKGWGSQLTLWDVYYHPFTIFNVWDSVQNDKSETVMYASKGQCPDLINKRECAFLPLTNCSMPSCFTTVTGDKVSKECWNGKDFLPYTGAFLGAAVAEQEANAEPHNAYQKKISASVDFASQKQNTYSSPLFIDAQGHKLNSPHPFDAAITPYAMLIRPNAQYRDMVMDEVHAYQQANSFPLGLPCVTFHIRRGDRVPKDTSNITEYCDQFVLQADGGCRQSGKETSFCGSADDYGCFTHNPYGALTLSKYLEQAGNLTEATTALIITDDGDWVRKEIQGLQEPWSNWNFNVFSTKYDNHSPKSSPSEQMKFDSISGRETSSGVEFLSTVALARQCQAFIGHFSSGFSVALYHLMCLQHGHSTGLCPHACDIGNVYDQNGNTIFARMAPVN
jgi:hypothetical protein